MCSAARLSTPAPSEPLSHLYDSANQLPNMLGDSATSKPILLIGDVGVGKTTFIRNLINVAARDILDKGIVLYLDLGVKPTITMALDQFIAGELTRQLRSDHDIDIEELSFLRGVYHIDLQQFEKGIWGSVRELDPAELLDDALLIWKIKLEIYTNI